MQSLNEKSVSGNILCRMTIVLCAYSVITSLMANPKMTKMPAIHNPERGLFLQTNYFAHNLQFTWDKKKFFPQKWVYKDTLTQYDVVDDKLSEIQFYFYLTKYVGKKIDAKGMANIQKVFDETKKNGYKLILRFAYDNRPKATKATFNDVFTHLTQLEPLIRKNIGLIDMWQIGFIGSWGEGHHSPMSGDWKNRSKLAKRLLQIFTDRQITIRYPRQKKRYSLTPEESLRCGFHNDYFTASEHSHAKNNDYAIGTSEYELVVKESPYRKVAGEIPYGQGGEWGLRKNVSVINTIKILRDHHFSAFDVTQNNKLNIAHWKKFELSREILSKNDVIYEDEYFHDSKGRVCTRSAYDFIRDHLGYRLYLDLDKTKLTRSGTRLIYDIRFRNVGFSAIHNPRPVYLAFVNFSRVVHVQRLDVDPSKWQPFDPDKNDYKVLTHRIKGEAICKMGWQKVGLWLPDPTKLLEFDPAYAIRFANSKIKILDNSKYLVNIIPQKAFRR